MSHWIITPILLPTLLGAFIVLSVRHQVALQRVFSLVGLSLLLINALGLFVYAQSGDIWVYELGAWPAPFGIVIMLDRLSALMVLLTAVLAMCVMLYAIGSDWDKRGKHFHALFQFQLMGVIGAFMTGDAFNLFVFFEILLIASYGLMTFGGGTRRLQAGTQYVIYNLLGSTLFLFALGTLYNVTGTLNMADMAARIAVLEPEHTALLRVGVVMALMVFAVKAAILPLHFWLPESYAAGPAPVAALFAIMTKVGAYAILRMFTLAFPQDSPAIAGSYDVWLLPVIVISLAVGMIGILGAKSLSKMVAYAAIGSVGTLLIAIALFTPEATAAAIYYVVHSTLATAALFLIVDLVVSRRPQWQDTIREDRPMPQNGLVAAFYFAAAIAMAGMPPLSGFLGKLLILDAAVGNWWLWGAILITSLIAIMGFGRAGSLVFWKGYGLPETDAPAYEHPRQPMAFVAIGALMAGIVAMTVLAGPMHRFAIATAEQLYDTDAYISAVINNTMEESMAHEKDGSGHAPVDEHLLQTEGGEHGTDHPQEATDGHAGESH